MSTAATTSYTYDPVTNGIATETDPDGNATAYTYDTSGNELTKSDPMGHERSWTYNVVQRAGHQYHPARCRYN